jgi:hypothetical protein
VGEDRHGYGLHVVGQHVVAPGQRRGGAGGAQQLQPGAGEAPSRRSGERRVASTSATT